ncbi:two-component system, OmpR family, response regulator [Neorhodopirellula lusitana]|uniref:Two-component system, OmpR family, response regulator n=1 Tax=Neorhodopirellula lusitana TaxID=445327 RepID=A0ABY1Q917_9BACT|nr:response regulator transcription factor [Neorhodopirellula lusitana]SMP63209.1 two-component system, OmpR family, response regulator [Neorhodopirellula lusitana]
MRAHILVVEDEQHLGVGIKYNLEAEGYRVSLVEDGPSALKLIDHAPQSIDLMVLDLMLPGMSGYSVCQRVRSEGLALPILMLSARTLPEDRTRGFDVGANQYMNKPFELDELLSRVKNLLQISQQTGQHSHGGNAAAGAKTNLSSQPVDSIEFGHVSVDFQTHQVFVDGKSVRMTPKELRLLRYFVENPERVISRSELLVNVWETSGNMQTRAVDQFIARLRKTIEPSPAEPVHLLTLRDAGYRFVLNPEPN